MILDDLKHFRASPEVPRLAVALIATAAIMLFALASTSLPNPDNAAPQARIEPAGTVIPERGLGQTQPAAAAPLGCTKLYRGQWLRVEIAHKGDREPYRLECFYGYGPQWQAL